ncbi:Rrf2 family transcriptional regulator [Altererythrobacter xixiisoli]|uniref:Rrf2 family transcriptional regulator n=1 Tax=Croceibacterium xixiisoli TaxID=1476466 RepID=A0A6I4TTG8_9SPHN|nr:Rrf2 family transcriptional regulator [Croceibacterium xixiisoli]MXO98421.1 Rrf2 family transcriptional regulator [Croceibacterium xixiisoli]
MQLKSQVEWALHCCAILGMLPPDRHLSAKALAEFHGVPKEYLSKALQSLSQAGVVHTTAGVAGGYRLARPAGELSFLDVVEAVEGRRSTFQCANIRANNPCRPADQCDDKPCAVARVMWDADAAWRASLAGVNLAGLAATLNDDLSRELLAASEKWVLDRAR